MKVIADTLEVARSNLCCEKKGRRRYNRKADDEHYLPAIRKITDQRATYGYRRVTSLMNREREETGQPPVNHKRIYRIMRVNNLLLPKHTGRPLRSHEGKVITLKSNMRWCSDIFEVPCDNNERVRVVFALDCADREVLSFMATTAGITAEMVKDLIALSIESRFGFIEKLPHVIQWLSDNGSAYTAHETRTFARLMGLELCTTPYHSPESNGMAESFIKTFKRDYVSMNDVSTAEAVMQQLATWFEDYNEYHPHKGLKMRSPRQYRRLQEKLEECPI